MNGIYVRVQIAPGVDPREQALLEAQRLAFKCFVQAQQGLEGQTFSGVLPADDELSNGVKDAAIQKEKITATQYQATLNLTFKPESVAKWLETGKPAVSRDSLSEQGVWEAPLAQSAGAENPEKKSLIVEKTVQVALHSFQDWLQIQQLLERLPHLETLNILEFSQTRGKIEVAWKGGEEDLKNSLAYAGFVVQHTADEQTLHVEKKREELFQNP